MARKATTTVLAEAPQIDEQIVRADLQANDLMIVTGQQQNARVRAVALRLGYQLPADATDPDLIQRDISANMRRSVEACLEVGRGLVVLKEACAHGQFMARLDVLGMEHSVAKRFMQAAAKFSNGASTHHLTKAAGNQTKLFEMLVLDDEQIEELELTGQTGELSLDDVATMSVKELRAAVRETREQKKALERLVAGKDAKINELTTSQPVTKGWNERVAPFKAEASAHFDTLDELIGRLYVAHGEILQADFGEEEDPEGAKLAMRSCAVLYGDRLNRLCQQLAELRDQYEATLAGWAVELDGHSLDPDVGQGAEQGEEG
ncbi:hypothetical protein [Thauera sp.]|uniref:hypothetical protein n=1 Tax=Thauera sp. TaxID=1905334 RepID=UPI0039E528A5